MRPLFSRESTTSAKVVLLSLSFEGNNWYTNIALEQEISLRYGAAVVVGKRPSTYSFPSPMASLKISRLNFVKPQCSLGNL